jgi:hypothetical protein
MTYNNLNQPEDDLEAQRMPNQAVSQEGIEALISALSHASANNEVAHLPTVKALKELRAENESSQKRIGSLEQKIGLLILEIGELKHRESDQNARLDKYMNRPTIAAFSILLGVIILVPSAFLYTFVPSKADRDISDIKEKSQFLYFQELDRFKKKKK